jgi:hypothetical protein
MAWASVLRVRLGQPSTTRQNQLRKNIREAYGL